jgi:N-acetylmuramoyl-L-alanine amidase
MSMIPIRLKQWLGILLGVSAVSVQAAPTNLTHVQVLKFPTYSRVIFSIVEPDRYHVFALSNPNRIVVDLTNAHLRADLRHFDLSDSPIASVRSGTPKPATLRVVFDMNTGTHFKSFIAPDSRAHEAQLVVDIFPTQKQANFVDTARSAQQPNIIKVPKPLIKAPTFIKAAPLPRYVEPAKKLEAQATAMPKPHSVVVVIDAGHGGKDPGTIGTNGGKEKEIVLGIAIRLASLINKEPNMRAILTRKGDYFVTLRDRLRLARKDKADLFVSIHADAYQNDQSTGVSVYALSRHGATSEAARWLASRENDSELGGVDFGELGDKSYMLRSVLIDLAQTATIADSVQLGTNVLRALENVTKLHDPHVEQAPFVVLKSPDIPSVLVETGYLSNPREEERLRAPEYRDRLAEALLSGIHRYLLSHPSVGA